MISPASGELLERAVQCPYCGEAIEVLVELSESPQSYIEDCQVCCRPINFRIVVDTDAEARVSVTSENE